MKCKLSVRLWTLVLLTGVMLVPAKELSAQGDKVAAFKQSLAQNQKRLQQYQWIETTVISLKGDEKSRVQKLCFYGPDGKVQKQQVSAPAQQQAPGGLKGRIAAKKKGEITEYMQQAVALIHQYVPPDPDRIQAAKNSGKLSVTPMGGAVRLDFPDFVKPGDSLSLTADTGHMALQSAAVKSYLDSRNDVVTLAVTFAALGDGVNHPSNTVLTAPAKNIQVVVQNSNYQQMQAVTQAPPSGGAPQGQGGSALSPQQIDGLTAPIALYPDALIAQILTSSTNVFELQSFAGWLGKNANLTGSALQDAAQKAGFDTCFVALAPFPQVVQMMTQKPDWTKQLGQVFAADRTAVFDSIQRLRAQAQSVGNLKSNQQQEVQTQTTSSGQQVIVIQPANPQVVYVPQYNPQVVYVQSAPSSSAAGAAAIGFTTGVIIGAAASNNYYHGPYAWHGAAMYNEAWDNRSDYANQRQDAYQQNSSQRQSASQANQSQRQSQSQSNQAQRQSSAASLQSNAQGNQAQRQSSASAAQGSRQAQQGQRQSAAGTSSFGSGQGAAQRSGMSSGGFSGYQGGGGARAESARGNSSLASSRGERGGGERGGGGGGRGGGRGGGGGRR